MNRDKINKRTICNVENTKVYITTETKLLPVVGNLYFRDIHLYSTKIEEGKILLIPIITYKGSWAELFTGETKYKENLFCLVSDLTDEERINFASKFILLKEVPEYLEEQKELKLKNR